MKKILFLTAIMCFWFMHIFANPISDFFKVDTGGTTIVQLCQAPYVGVIPATNGLTATVRWSLDVIPSVYQVEFHLAGDTAWSAPIKVIVGRRDSNFTVLKNLSACTKYEARVRKVCADTLFSNWTKYAFVSGNCPPPCYQPINLGITYNDTSATIKWATYGTSDSVFVVQWKKNADTLWQSSTVKNIKSFSLSGLSACTIYTVRIKTNCSATSSSGFATKDFKTTGCITTCPTPSQLYYTTSGAKTSIAWVTTSAGKYDLQYRIVPDTNWVDTVILTKNYFNLPVSGTCDKYEVRVRSLCSSTEKITYSPASAWSNIFSFTTQGCTVLCSAPSRINVYTTLNSALISWDSTQGNNIKIYSLDWTSLADTSKHTIVNNISKISYILNNLTGNTAYRVRIRVQCPNGNQGVWSPFLNFKTFTPVCYKPLQYSVTSQDFSATFAWSTVSGTTGKVILWILSSDSSFNKSFTLTGNTATIMLPSCKNYTARFKSLCNDTLSSEYTEALNFKTGACPLPCGKVYAVTSLKTDSSTALITWAASTAVKYYVEYAVATTTTPTPNTQWKRDSATSNIIVLKNLTACQYYFVRVSAVCSTGVAESSAVNVFKTTGCPPPCDLPSAVKLLITSDTIAGLSWSGKATNGFEVQYRSAQDTAWTISSTKDSTLKIVLKPCTHYAFRIRSDCGNSQSDWITIDNSVTGGCTLACAKPNNVKIASVDSVSVKLSWDAPSATKFYVEYKLASDSALPINWKRDSATADSIILKGFTACQGYYVRVFAVCTSNLSESSNVIYFRMNCPLPNCIKPANLQVLAVDTATATISWAGSTIGKFYVDSYVIDNTGGSTTTPTPIVKRDSSSTSSVTLKNLTRCKYYGVKVYAICANNILSDAGIIYFSTKGCTSTPTTACNAPENIQTSVSQDTVVNILWSTVTGASRYEVQLSIPGNPTVLPKSVIAAQPKIILSGLKICTNYSVLVRSICDTTPGKWSAPITFATGRCPRNVCASPTVSIQKTDSTSVSILLSSTGAIQYYIDYRDVADSLKANGGWKHDSTVNLSKTILGLLSCHNYLVQASSSCSFALSAPSAAVPVSTVCKSGNSNPGVFVCTVPTNLIANVTDTIVLFTWIGNTDTLSAYDLRIRSLTGDTTWFPYNGTDTSLTVSGFARCHTYQWQVRKVCSKVPGDWATLSVFSTTSGCGGIAQNVTALAVQNNLLQDFSVVPNPSSDYMEVGYTLQRKANLSIDIFNWQGQIVSRRNLGEQDPAYYVQKYDDVNNLPTGLYLISVNANGRTITSQKWLKIE